MNKSKSNTNIINELKNRFTSGSILVRLIYINIAVFLFILISGAIYSLINPQAIENPLVLWLAVPADITQLYKFWTLITYMFLHQDFLHILFNMLWLYWFGIIFLQYLDQRKLLGVYILGGLAGAVLYIVIYNLIPALEAERSIALGASASVMAIVIATAVYVPDYRLNLLFIGPVKLKYIALVAIGFDVLSILESSNVGGHIAHIGGALFGYFYIQQYRKGVDLTRKTNEILDDFFDLFKSKPKMKVSYKKTKPPTNDMEYNAQKQTQQEEIDRILDKISKSGYDSLTKAEKEKLFKMSKE